MTSERTHKTLSIYMQGIGECDGSLSKPDIVCFLNYIGSSSEPSLRIVIICLFLKWTKFMCLISKCGFFM